VRRHNRRPGYVFHFNLQRYCFFLIYANILCNKIDFLSVNDCVKICLIPNHPNYPMFLARIIRISSCSRYCVGIHPNLHIVGCRCVILVNGGYSFAISSLAVYSVIWLTSNHFLPKSLMLAPK